MILHLVVPGALDQRTGGYIYDARMVAGLRQAGWTVPVHELPGDFPCTDPSAKGAVALDEALAGLPDGTPVAVDGLALGGLPEVAAAHAPRLALLGVVHHPLGDETGLPADRAAVLLEREVQALGRCRGVVVTSRFTAGRLEELGIPGDGIRPVLPGTEPAVPAPGPGADAPLRFLSVGTVSPRKGHDILAQALARVRELPWRCTVAGSTEREPGWADRVRGLVAEEGLEDRIEFAGELGEAALDAAYASASVFVLPSHYEGYGMALTEALARGLPVVSTTGGAIPWTVPEDAGVLVEPGDVEALAGVLRRLLTDDGFRERLAAHAAVRGGALPTWDEQVAAFAGAVREFAARGAPLVAVP